MTQPSNARPAQLSQRLVTAISAQSPTRATRSPWPSRGRMLALATAVLLTACKGKDGTTGPAPITSRSGLVPTSSAVILEFAGSQIINNGQSGQMFDDFTFTSAGTVRTVQWQGAYCVPVTNAPAPTPTASAFRISIYPDAGGRPVLASPVAQATYPIAQVGQTLDLTIPGLECTPGRNVTYATYSYTATLSTPVTIAANTKYWFSVQAVTPSYATAWGWRDGVNDNRTSLRYINNQYVETTAYDRAFALRP
jgi:hypothetical protein